MATKKCPVCGVSVKVENLERHLRNQHPKVAVESKELLSADERKDLEKGRAVRGMGLTRTGKRIIAIAAIVVAVVLVLIIFNPFGSTGVQPGQMAPAFNLTTSDSGSVTLSSLLGKAILIEFMDPDCPHCQHEAPVLASLYVNYSARANFLSIYIEVVPPTDTAATLNQFKTAYNTPWTYALADGSVAQNYGVSQTPTMFILTPKGVVVREFTGETPYLTLAGTLDQALQG